jgi:hypothetical protein
MEDRAPILPPPPPLRIVVWAVLNAMWFRVAGVVLGALHRARRLSEVLELETSPRVFARDGRLSSLIARLACCERRASDTLRDPVRAERPTAVDVRRG